MTYDDTLRAGRKEWIGLVVLALPALLLSRRPARLGLKESTATRRPRRETNTNRRRRSYRHRTETCQPPAWTQPGFIHHPQFPGRGHRRSRR